MIFKYSLVSKGPAMTGRALRLRAIPAAPAAVAAMKSRRLTSPQQCAAGAPSFPQHGWRSPLSHRLSPF